MPDAPAHTADRLVAAIDRAGAPACVGIDPVLERLPDAVRDAAGSETDAVRAFCLGVLDALDPGTVPVVKPQSACFERFGSAGVAVLEDVIARARDRGFFVVLDVKRGDIGSTAAHYAAAAAGMGADAVTVNAYMGPSAVTPFLDAGLMVYLLVRTSNPDSDRVQTGRLVGGGTVAEHMARLVDELGSDHLGDSGLSAVGAVVGATKSAADGAALRELMPNAPLLVPGVGAQGGTVGEARPLCRPGATTPGGLGVLINASRSVLYPAGSPADSAAAAPSAEAPPAGSWTDNVRSSAERFAAETADLGV